jgi:hypothetical protein
VQQLLEELDTDVLIKKQMKIKPVLFEMLLSIPLLMSCGHEKVIANNAQEGTKLVSQAVTVPSDQKSIVYAKSKKQIKEEQKAAKAKSNKPVVNNVTQTTTLVEKKNETAKDTTINRPIGISFSVKPDSITVKPTYKVSQISSFVRTPADLKKFSVVVGSFSSLEKTSDLVLVTLKAGYKPMIVKNENGMFRVIASTYNNRDSADIDVLGFELDSIKSWIFVKK